CAPRCSPSTRPPPTRGARGRGPTATCASPMTGTTWRPCWRGSRPRPPLAVDRHLALAAGDRLPGDERTTDQRHADALVDLLLGDGSGITAQVQAPAPAAALAGLSDARGERVGLAPIPARLARLIARDATWRR